MCQIIPCPIYLLVQSLYYWEKLLFAFITTLSSNLLVNILLRFFLLLIFLFCLGIFLKYMDVANMSYPRRLNLIVSQVHSNVGLACLLDPRRLDLVDNQVQSART